MDDFKTMIKWMESIGFRANKFPVEAFDFPETGRGIRHHGRNF